MDLNVLRMITIKLKELEDLDCVCGKKSGTCKCPLMKPPSIAKCEEFQAACKDCISFISDQMDILSDINDSFVQTVRECKGVASSTKTQLAKKFAEMMMDDSDEDLDENKKIKRDTKMKSVQTSADDINKATVQNIMAQDLVQGAGHDRFDSYIQFVEDIFFHKVNVAQLIPRDQPTNENQLMVVKYKGTGIDSDEEQTELVVKNNVLAIDDEVSGV